jgi:hypothetical protein
LVADVAAVSKIGYPVPGARWAKAAAELAFELHRETPFDVALSRAPPESAHLPALAFVRQTSVPWIANWNDPFEFMRTGGGKPHLRSNLGLFCAAYVRKVAQVAHWHTFPSRGLQERMAQHLGREVLERGHVVPHVSPAITLGPCRAKAACCRIFCAGNMTRWHEPGGFLDALAESIREDRHADWEFAFAGVDQCDMQGMVRRLGIQDHYRALGALPYLETVRLMTEADILLAIDPPGMSGALLLSKLSDYAVARRPILALAPPNSTTHALISASGAGLCVDGQSPPLIRDTITRMYDLWEKGRLQENFDFTDLEARFAPATIVGRYEDLFHRLRDALEIGAPGSRWYTALVRACNP